MLRYLKGTQEYGIQYTRDLKRLRLRNQKLNTLYGHSDSDFPGCCDAARSTSGNVILMNAGKLHGIQVIRQRQHFAQQWLRQLH